LLLAGRQKSSPWRTLFGGGGCSGTGGVAGRLATNVLACVRHASNAATGGQTDSRLGKKRGQDGVTVK